MFFQYTLTRLLVRFNVEFEQRANEEYLQNILALSSTFQEFQIEKDSSQKIDLFNMNAMNAAKRRIFSRMRP